MVGVNNSEYKNFTKKFAIFLSTLLVLLFLTACEKAQQPGTASYDPASDAAQPMSETLLITTTAFSNGENDDDGVDLLVYECDTNTLNLQLLFSHKIYATYPANTVDFSSNTFYVADANEERLYDNLFSYNLENMQKEQLTDGKFAFDDLLMIDGTLYANAAREYCNACQPARFDTKSKTFTYRNESDDDTMHASFSYDRYEDAFLILTYKISERRSHRVAAETHITPKTISYLSKDFKTVTPVFFTEDFEINLVRRLDKTHILMTTEPYMTGKRTLKLLNLETNEVTNVDIPGILQVYMFYPLADGNTVFLIGQNTEPSWNCYRYEMDTGTLTKIDCPKKPRQIFDLQVTNRPYSVTSE